MQELAKQLQELNRLIGPPGAGPEPPMPASPELLDLSKQLQELSRLVPPR
jgi:hypothetical protein